MHTYLYDPAGRLSADTVDLSNEQSGQNVDDRVLAIVTAYDDLGRVYTVTSYDSVTDRYSTDVVNQVEYAYDGWGNEIQEWQSHSGAVDPNSTPSVQYTYADGANGTGEAAQYMRLSYVTYPDSGVIGYTYGEAGSIDNALSRVTAITFEDSTTIVQYTYLGAGTVASEYEDLGTEAYNNTLYDDLEIGLDYSANNFGAWDHFGRIVNQDWNMYSNSGVVLTSLGTLDGYTYTYDSATGNVLTRSNVTKTDGSLDETYGYNALDELISMSRGTTYSQGFTLDAAGNMATVTTNGNAVTRTTDAANEIQTISGSSNPTYDAAGNMTFDGTLAYKYDAWGRLVAVYNGSLSGNQVAAYSYDGLGRRIQTKTYTDGTLSATQDYYLNQSDQVVVELRARRSGIGHVVPVGRPQRSGPRSLRELRRRGVSRAAGRQLERDGACGRRQRRGAGAVLLQRVRGGDGVQPRLDGGERQRVAVRQHGVVCGDGPRSGDGPLLRPRPLVQSEPGRLHHPGPGPGGPEPLPLLRK